MGAKRIHESEDTDAIYGISMITVQLRSRRHLRNRKDNFGRRVQPIGAPWGVDDFFSLLISLHESCSDMVWFQKQATPPNLEGIGGIYSARVASLPAPVIGLCVHSAAWHAISSCGEPKIIPSSVHSVLPCWWC